MKAKDIYDSGEINHIEVGTFKGLSHIHNYLFEDIYFFVGKVRKVNLAKGNFRFAPVMYLSHSLEHINTMPQTTFDEIVEKYVEMNIAHPFREGNGRATRIWLDLILRMKFNRWLTGLELIKKIIYWQWNAAQLKILKLSIYSKMH